jgi:hypothetical protein
MVTYFLPLWGVIYYALDSDEVKNKPNIPDYPGLGGRGRGAEAPPPPISVDQLPPMPGPS